MKTEKAYGYIQNSIRKHTGCLWFIVFLMFLFALGITLNRIERKKIEVQQKEWVQYEEEMPENGTQRNYWPNEYGEKVVYDFASPAPNCNVLVRFFNMDKKVLAADLFIYAGTKKSEVALVAGEYKIVYASGGSKWYGYKKLWGLATVFGTARANTQVTGHEMRTEWRGKRCENNLYVKALARDFGEL